MTKRGRGFGDVAASGCAVGFHLLLCEDGFVVSLAGGDDACQFVCGAVMAADLVIAHMALVLAQFPSFSARINLERDAGEGGVNAFGPQVNLSLPVFSRNRGQIAIQEATRELLRPAISGTT